MSNVWEALSEERKEMQAKGLLPEWYTTHAWQIFKDKYLFQAEGFSDQYKRIADTMAVHAPKEPAPHWDDPNRTWGEAFYDLFWKNILVASTPVAANSGNKKGYTVSCSAGEVGDSVSEFFKSYAECAMLSKFSFGTAYYLGHIRPRGQSYGVADDKAAGVIPIVDGLLMTTGQITQGSRRGAVAVYLEVTHGDFWELVDKLKKEPKGLNVGWIIEDSFIEALNSGDQKALERFQAICEAKSITGKGYFQMSDTANRLAPEAIKRSGLKIKGSNLCNEIMLPTSEKYTYTCVLSSLNIAEYDNWTEGAVFESTVFLDCVAEEFIVSATNDGHHEFNKTIRFTEDFRALGLGALGFHTYLQKEMIPLDSLMASAFNKILFKKIRGEAEEATKWMAEVLGEPLMCEGLGRRNSTLLAIAPNMSSALLAGGISQGIEPLFTNAYTQSSAGGDMKRVNPVLIELMKDRGVYNDETITKLVSNDGSVQGDWCDWLEDSEKLVFKTAYEWSPYTLIKLAADRQEFIDQGQSLNLFFNADDTEEYIAKVYQTAICNPKIKGVYYARMSSATKASNSGQDRDECVSCN